MLPINLEDDKYRYELTIFGYGLFIGTLIAGPFTPLIPYTFQHLYLNSCIIISHHY